MTGIQSLSHEQYLLADGVSNSMLKVISESSPLHLKWQIDGGKKEQTEAQKIGAITHRSIFEPETMESAFYVRPDGMKFTTKEGMAWKEAHADRPILTANERDSICAMVSAVQKHPTASRLLKNAAFEQSCFAEDSLGTLRKWRPDILPSGGNILPDLKTCEDASPRAFEKSIAQWGYYRQAAYYLDGCKLLNREFENFVLIAVEKNPPYAVVVYPIDPLAIRLGRIEYERDLATYRECLETGIWPGYQDQVLSLPFWKQKELESTL